MKRLPFFLSLTVAFTFAGCSKNSHDHPHQLDESRDHHVHQGPHNGTLVELGDHQFSIEFVHDPAAGSLTLYVLDAHAENFIRLPDRAIEALVQRNGQPTPLTLAAVANDATGETVGDTSQFTGTADWLKSPQTIELAVPALTVRGLAFQDIRAAIAPR
jgi:hypothetical protein